MKLYFLALDTKKATDPWFKALLKQKKSYKDTYNKILIVDRYHYKAYTLLKH